MYRLTDDYLNADCLVHKLWQGEYREAPAVMERAGKYYMFSSFCTGWAPNQCRYACADSMEGRWSTLTDIGDSTTYRTQPAFILPVEKEGKTVYYYVADRWNGKDYHDSRYVILYGGRPSCNGVYGHFSGTLKETGQKAEIIVWAAAGKPPSKFFPGFPFRSAF